MPHGDVTREATWRRHKRGNMETSQEMPHRDVTLEATWRRHKRCHIETSQDSLSCHWSRILSPDTVATGEVVCPIPHGAPPSQAMKQVQGSKYRPMLATDTAILFKFDAILIFCD
ncbi:hypothetical protein BgiMline_002925 [Biomphalaria glabrata]